MSAHTDRSERNAGKSKLRIVPTTSEESIEYVSRYHRHHRALKVGYVFSVAVADETGTIRGVAVVGRPAAINSVDGFTLEVRRVATDGCPNACSALYAAAKRVCQALGYRKLITYILDTESGISLKALAWENKGPRGGGTWDRPGCGRPRVDTHPTQGKILFEVEL